MRKVALGKFGKMRKPQEFSVQRDQFGIYLIQSYKSTGRLDGKGRGIFSTQGCYFHNLTPQGGALSILFPADFVKEVQELYWMYGERMGTGVIYAKLTSAGDKFSLLAQYLAYENNFASHDKITVSKGQIMWNLAEQKLMPYEGGELTGSWRRYSPEQWDENFAEICAAETVEEKADDV